MLRSRRRSKRRAREPRPGERARPRRNCASRRGRSRRRPSVATFTGARSPPRICVSWRARRHAPASLLDDALAKARPGSPRAEVLLALGRLHLHAADQAAARDLAAQALAEPAASSAVRADSGQLLACAQFFMREDLPAALRHISAAATVAADTRDPTLIGTTQSMKAVLEVMLGRAEWERTLGSLAHEDALRGQARHFGPGVSPCDDRPLDRPRSRRGHVAAPLPRARGSARRRVLVAARARRARGRRVPAWPLGDGRGDCAGRP